MTTQHLSPLTMLLSRHTRRRAFITLVGGAAAWPLAPRAQQAAVPTIGYLDSRSPDAVAARLRAFRQGLKEAGFVEGENVAILYRFAENQMDRLPQRFPSCSSSLKTRSGSASSRALPAPAGI